MSHQSAYHRAVLRDKGTFEGKDFLVSTDSISWIRVDSLSITEHGQLYSSDEQANHYLLLQSLQSCHIQIMTNVGQSSTSKQQQQQQQQHSPPSKRSLVAKRNGHQQNETLEDEPPTVFIKTFDNDKLYIRVASKANFGNLISSLIVWQNLKPQGLAKKWYSENKVVNQIDVPPNELLVCRFKIYGPLPNKYKNLNIINGPQAPTYQPKIDDFVMNSHNGSVFQQSGDNNINEGWFYAMGALNSNGILNIISELDGTLLYSIDIKTILASEIREVHHSIFNSSNVLFVGQLKELRYNNTIRTTTTLTADQLLTTFLTREGKIIPSNHRIFIEFPLHIDLEDWFVGLNYFAKREYIGSFNNESKLVIENRENPQLRDFSKAHFRVSKKLTIDIIEAKFENITNNIHSTTTTTTTTNNNNNKSSTKIYAEVRMWGYPWSRTAIVNQSNNPFWKEEFSTDLPISTQMIHILIKRCNHDASYSPQDKLIGTIYVTPDILTKQIRTSSTIMTSAGSVNSIQVNSIPLPSITDNANSTNLDIMRLTIYDPNNIPIGKLLIEVNLKEHHILPPQYFKPMEKMLVNAPWKDLIKFCNENVSSAEFERISVVLLDIFQSLGVEDEWFKNLMESELVNLDMASRKSYHKRNSQDKKDTAGSTSSNNVFNTLFRGSSIFSKSLEKYNLRIGQEYLEKVFGDFFAKIDAEGKNCEVDPRYVRVQERALRKDHSTIDDADDFDDDSSDGEYDSDLEREKDERVKQMVEENYQNLLRYAEEIWHKIYITSNDLPDQIKTQLKNFRSKVELVCEPDDKTTSLNCVSAFLFLRFFCPAILNPKLFYLAKNHQTGSTQRTLTLIAKILLNLANRQEFSVHKEPHLIKLNPFLRSHKDEVITYFNRITGRSNDFNEKILDLSHELKRINLGLDQSSNELPSTPYLIDHYLRLTELAILIASAETSSSTNQLKPSGSITGDAVSSNFSNSVSATPQLELIHPNLDELDEGDENKDVYKIGALEFERNDLLDLAGEDNADGFIHSLCKDNEHIFSFINENITFKDIQNQSRKLAKKVNDWDTYLENYEFPMNYYSSNDLLWQVFGHYILKNTWLDSRGCISSSSSLGFSQNTSGGGSLSIYRQRGGYKNLIDDHAMASLKLKFGDEQYYRLKSTSLSSLNSTGGVFSGSSIGSSERSSGSESLKKIKSWFKR
ncbi:Bud2 GTPase activating protein (GAP) for Rsr1p [Candida orthopsilosis Co 90-125]|uniref:Bud2 GTPase activating protein (GAP) for Rsr1p n=1 Tax=Candida orthopsilosis (strain 90-125) TaxID=1136231 RepID=H8X8A2_CANO9|nr:Bud2 GTPase activating protein (GAP) for Rsr1p [Candida orthopsilosis Co 90-125]CCG24201.1 Bud2 GTPase activating protein (GAP) for Rsr1p [Candida orthopsilosis Co 90-125]